MLAELYKSSLDLASLLDTSYTYFFLYRPLDKRFSFGVLHEGTYMQANIEDLTRLALMLTGRNTALINQLQTLILTTVTCGGRLFLEVYLSTN